MALLIFRPPGLNLESTCRRLPPEGTACVLVDMVARFAQAPEFTCNLVCDGDVTAGACYASAYAEVGADIDLRPPAGRYVALASGPPLAEEFPTLEPPAEPRRPIPAQSICLWGSFFNLLWAGNFAHPGQPIVVVRPYRGVPCARQPDARARCPSEIFDACVGLRYK
eukprot:2894597-Alexandrium_andersonii.AAC.1